MSDWPSAHQPQPCGHCGAGPYKTMQGLLKHLQACPDRATDRELTSTLRAARHQMERDVARAEVARLQERVARLEQESCSCKGQ